MTFKEKEWLNDHSLLLGKKVYALRCLETSKGQPAGKYAYRIYPATFIVKEIRIGCAFEDKENPSHYGPGEISFVCEHESGNYMLVFSPVGDELISKATIAGRAVHGFLSKDDLLCEAEIIKDRILRSYKHVGDAYIDLK